MPFDPYLGERISGSLKLHKVEFEAKKMMGGLVFMVQGKMACGIHIDKKLGHSLLMARIGEKAYAEEIKKQHCLPMDFTGRPMKGYLFVMPEGFDLDDDLDYWISKVLEFNRSLVA